MMWYADIDTYNHILDKILATLIILYVDELRSNLC